MLKPSYLKFWLKFFGGKGWRNYGCKWGDQNTKYIHACATNERRYNHLCSLIEEDGKWVNWDSGLPGVIESYYRELFKESNTCWSRVTNWIDRKITENQHMTLLQPVEAHELKTTLFQMNPDKSPWPDSFNLGCYQKYWDIVGSDVFQMVNHIFVTGEFS